MLALVLADGDVPTRAVLDAAWPGWADGIGLVVAADGGARHAASLGFAIDLWVGDGDSVDPDMLAALEAAGVEVRRSRTDKDETDTELAIRAALARDPRGVIVIGATGGPRIDHELANIGLLAMPELRGTASAIHTPRSRITLLRGDDRRGGGIAGGEGATTRILGAPGDLVSLIPFGVDATGVTTTGLRYPLRDATLPVGTPRGISNVVASVPASVSLGSGLLLVIETPADETADEGASTIGP